MNLAPMPPLPIEIDWSKVPGPNFLGPRGEVKDIDDWRVVVTARLNLGAAIGLTRFEANDPRQFDEAKFKVARMMHERVYGEVNRRLRDLETQLRFEMGQHQNPEVMKKYREIIQLTDAPAP